MSGKVTVGLAIHHGPELFIHLCAQGLSVDMSMLFMLLMGYGTVYLQYVCVMFSCVSY